MIFLRKEVAYPAVLVWAFLGIWVKQGGDAAGCDDSPGGRDLAGCAGTGPVSGCGKNEDGIEIIIAMV